MSGFIYACTENHARSALVAIKKLTPGRDGSLAADRELINTIEESINHVLRGSNSLLITIARRFEQLNEAEADSEVREQLREKLRQLFPGISLDGEG